MNTRMIFVAIAAMGVMLCLAGCILPIPHTKQHICATQGIVIDGDDGKPVAGAKVKVFAGRYAQETTTDSSGHFSIAGERGWHMIFWIAPPSAGSLLTTHNDYCDGFVHSIVISALGYPSQAFRLGASEANATYTYPLEKQPTEESCLDEEGFPALRERFPIRNGGTK
jgi:hypothetical protein